MQEKNRTGCIDCSGMEKRNLALPSMILGAIMAALLLHPTNAAAQSRDRNIDLRLDLKRDRQQLQRQVDAPVAATRRSQPKLVEGAEEKNFTLEINLPFKYNTNINASDFDEEQAWHTNPEISLTWERQFDSFHLAATASTDIDRYVNASYANSETLSGGLTLTFVGREAAKSGNPLTPYVGYLPSRFSTDFYGEHSRTQHEFYAGIRKKFDIAPIFKFPSGKDLSLTFNVSVWRREVVNSTRDSTAAVASISASQAIDDHWSLGITPTLRVRWYDKSGGGRRDTTVTVVTRATWTPDWLTQALPNASPQIAFGAFFARNASTGSGGNFSQWDIGPAVNVSWQF